MGCCTTANQNNKIIKQKSSEFEHSIKPIVNPNRKETSKEEDSLLDFQ